MLYHVLVDGTDILDFGDPEKVLLSPQADIEMDVSGSFEFTIPPNHFLYDMFTAESIMPMTVEIYEGNILHWFGRPIELHLDFYKNKKLYCEGALGFFNDSVIREAEYENTSLSTIFSAVISEHNSMVPSNRQFTVGQFTVDDTAVYRKFDYEQTSDVLKSKFLDAVEGHFFVRRISGVNYIDFLKDMPYTCNQVVQFAKNLLNFTYSFDGKDFATCVIPLGANDSETGKPTTIASVNNGSDILVGNAATNYGKIVKVQHYSDLTSPADLKSEGQKYLTNLQYNAFLIECSAVDLHVSDETKNQFRVGQKVTCISDPHGINLELPISKMTLYLDSAAKQITLGRIPKKTLSRFYKQKVSGSEKGDEDDGIPDGWAIVPPDTDGDEPTLKKVPVRIQITELPYTTSYEEGEAFDPTGLIVKLVASTTPSITYFTDSRYPDSEVPMNELSFYYQDNGQLISLSTLLGYKTVSDIPIAQITVWVFWVCPYDNKKHGQAFYITNEKQAAIDEANGPDHIGIVIPPSKTEYYDGEHISLSGAKVVAYMANNQPYTGHGYQNGIIPNSELTLEPAVVDAEGEGGDPSYIEMETEDGLIVCAYKKTKYVTDYWSQGIHIYLKESVCDVAIGNFYIGGINNPTDGTIYLARYNGLLYGSKSAGDDGQFNKFTKEPSGVEGHTLPYTVVESRAGLITDYPNFSITGSVPDWMQSLPDSSISPLNWDGEGIVRRESQQAVTVSWVSPNGNTLQTSFTIKVKSGGILSGR